MLGMDFQLKVWFIKKGYREAVIEKEMKKDCFSKQSQKSKNVEKGILLVVTYHPLLHKLNCLIYRNLYLLYMNQETKNVYTQVTIMPFISARKISSYLV